MDANHHHHHRHHHHHQKQGREKSVDTKHGPSYDHHHHQDQKSSPPQSSSSSCSKQQQVTISPASPPSASSSPSHEFSFTISLHSSHPTSTTKTTTKDKTMATSKSKTQPPPSFAIDLSPADDIFFHGHLLPLHLLSHLPVSPRSSTNYLESFTLPIKDLTSPNDTQKQPTKNIINNHKNSTSTSTSTSSSSSSSSSTTTTTTNTSHKTEPTTKGSSRANKPKSLSSSFSLFGLRKWRREREDNNIREKPKRKMRFEVSHVLKRYMRMVRPLLFFGRRRDHHNSSTSFDLRRQPYSFSGILSPRNNSSTSTSKLDFRGIRRRGDNHQYSAPASMRTSPSNSGLLVATKMATATIHSSASDSTMEELQAAIQAAIAHCKNSIAAEDHKLKC